MTTPDPARAEVERVALSVYAEWVRRGHHYEAFLSTVADALLTRERDTRRLALEEAAVIADASHQTTWPDDNDNWKDISPYRAAVDEAKRIAAAIRASAKEAE